MLEGKVWRLDNDRGSNRYIMVIEILVMGYVSHR